MRQSKEERRFILFFIVLIGVTALLLAVFGKSGEKGLFTFSNLFFSSIIFSFFVFAIKSAKYSFDIARGFFKKKQNGAAMGQLAITVFAIGICGSVIWGFCQTILKNIR